MNKFWEKVDKSGDCWEWLGYREKNGYGRVSFQGNNKMLAHRVSWLLSNGEIPDGLCVLHQCDNPGCVNPDHLFLGTIADNNADRDAKGRGKQPELRGDKHPNAVLKDADVIVIRGMIKDGCAQRAVAKLFGVSEQLICDIKMGRRWSHVA